MAKQKADILPYKMATLSIGEKEQFINLTYWSKSKNKYERDKVRATVRGVRTTKEQRIAILKLSLPEINRELKRRNKLGIFHEDIAGVGKSVGMQSYLFCVDMILQDKKHPASTLRTIKSYRNSFSAFQEHIQREFHPMEVDINVMRDYVDYLRSNKNANNKVYTNKTINDYLWGSQLVSETLKNKSIIQEASTLKNFI